LNNVIQRVNFNVMLFVRGYTLAYVIPPIKILQINFSCANSFC